MELPTSYYGYHIVTNQDIRPFLKSDEYFEDEPPFEFRRGTGDVTDRSAGGSGGGICRGGRATSTRRDSEESFNSADFRAGSPEETPSEITSRGESFDEIACSIIARRKNYTSVNPRTPWKVISYHTGTRNNHYHLLYISTNKNWGTNSKLGKIIKATNYMCRKITCVSHLMEYFTPSASRKTIRNLLTEKDKRNFKCAPCQLGIPIGRKRQDESMSIDSERGAPVLREQSPAQNQANRGVDTVDTEANENLPTDRHRGPMECEQGDNAIELQQAAFRTRGHAQSGRSNFFDEQNNVLVLLLCDNRAFSEGDAQRTLCQSPEGITVQFGKNFSERLKTAISISRILVFSETIETRLERAKSHYLRFNPNANHPDEVNNSLESLYEILIRNGISIHDFASATRDHFYKRTKKKNNLFFYGPPSCGKTMIMESLVTMHYNFERLTGLTPGSSFNFSSLLHTNACFMDECKLTDNQFEQWKLLAGGQPMCTDVKYKNRHNITDCVLYTASNYLIDTYLQVPEAAHAIETRTITFKFHYGPIEYFKISPWTWEALWEKQTVDSNL